VAPIAYFLCSVGHILYAALRGGVHSVQRARLSSLGAYLVSILNPGGVLFFNVLGATNPWPVC
jgi:hypothetical protein